MQHLLCLLLLLPVSAFAQAGKNYQPRVAMTNSLAGGVTVLPLELVSNAAAGAYSVSRLLTNAYTGALALVVRSSDGATNYLTGTATGNNIAAITTWAGSDMVYVTNLFDQTGNARHLVSGATNNCFTIITNGVAVAKGGKTAMKRVSTTSALTASSVVLSEPVTYLLNVYNVSSTASDIIVNGGGTTRMTVKQLASTYRLNNTSNVDVETLTAGQWDILQAQFLVSASAPDQLAVDGGTFATGEAGSNASTSLSIGSTTVSADMIIGEWMLWNAEVDTTELAEARDNMNAFWTIY